MQLLHLSLQRLCHLFLLTNSKDEAEKLELQKNKLIKRKQDKNLMHQSKELQSHQDQIKDETFASGMLGKGVGIRPSESVVYAPFDGVISSVTETKQCRWNGFRSGCTAVDPYRN